MRVIVCVLSEVVVLLTLCCNVAPEVIAAEAAPTETEVISETVGAVLTANNEGVPRYPNPGLVVGATPRAIGARVSLLTSYRPGGRVSYCFFLLVG